MRVTVCQLPDDRLAFGEAWADLCKHIRIEKSDVVLLPEMPFARWFAAHRQFDPAVWRMAVEAHDAWSDKLKDLAPATVLYSRPAEHNGKRINVGIIATHGAVPIIAHEKRYLPDEEGFWEASWYERGAGDFTVSGVHGALAGFQICTDLWTFDAARQLGRLGADFIACPRATPSESIDRWVVAGRAAAMAAGAYSLSSNRSGEGAAGVEFAGQGWIIGPEGDVLGLTSDQIPFLTCDINLFEAQQAKKTYPRYVR